MDTTAPTPLPSARRLLALATLLAVLAGALGVLLGPVSPAAATGPYREIGPGVAIPSSGPAQPWPSAIPDVQRGRHLTDISVTLSGVRHTCAKDLDIVLSHNGRQTLLMSDVGDQSLSIGCHDIAITQLTIDDDCAAFPVQLPPAHRTWPGAPLCARPTDADGLGHEADVFPGLGVDPTAAPLRDTFTPVDATGRWELHVVDDKGNDAGSIDSWAIYVTTTDQPPVVHDASATAFKGEPLRLPFTGTDPDDGGLASCELLNGSAKALIDRRGCETTYTALPGTSGAERLPYVATDRAGHQSLPAAITVTIVNRPPVATPVTVSVGAGQRVALGLGGSDPDPQETATCTGVQGTDLGTVEGEGCDRTYLAGPTPGVDELTYTVVDGFGGQATGTVRVTVTSTAPTADAKQVTAPKPGGTAIALTGSVPGGGSHSCEADTATAQRTGTLTGTGCERTFVPHPGTSGTDTFTYLVRDGQGRASARATVTITIPNRAPVATDLVVPVGAGERTTIDLPGTDADAEPLTCTLFSIPVLGRLEGDGCRRTYVAGTEPGDDNLRFRVTDPTGASSESTVVFSVEDRRPQAEPEQATAHKGVPVTIDLGAPGLTCTVPAATAQGKGTLSTAGCRVTYTPTARASGTDTFTYTVKDAAGRTSAPATVTITIQNRAPSAPRQAITVLPGDSAAVVLGGTDPDPGEGAALTCTPVTGPTTNGRVGGTGCYATYVAGTTPGTDTIVYSVRDPFGATAAGVVDVTIAGTAPAGCTASDPQDARYVCRTYTDLLGRTADASGKAYWVGRLARGESRATIIKAFTGTPEYRTSVVRGIWRAYLGTTPDAATTQRWVEQLGRGANPDLVRQEALASAAFLARAGGTPEGFVVGLHQQLLRRPATTAEVTTIAAQLRAGTSRTTVVGRLLATTEADTATVAAVYERFLRRSPPTVETDYWVGRLQRGESELALVRMIVASAEYHGRA